MLTAHRFGVSTSLDVFNLAYSFPGTIVLLFSGAVVSAFVPLYLEWRNQLSHRKADSHATWLIYITSLIFAFLSLICFVFSPEIIRVIGYGFHPEEQELAIIMERLLILLIFIDGAGILFRGILHARKLFFHLYVAPIFVNIIIIFFLFYDMGLDIYVLVWGFLIGTILKTLYMGIALYREGFQFGTPMPFDREKMKALWVLAIPMLGSQLIANSNLMIDQMMSTQLPAGSVSTLRYAFRINDLPIQVVIAAVSRAIFPFISEEATAGNQENLQNIFKYSLIFLGFLTIPITCLMILFSEDLVVVLLKRGAFDAEAARQTGQTLACYSIGLFFYAYTFINGAFFAALQNTKALLYMGIVSIFSGLILCTYTTDVIKQRIIMIFMICFMPIWTSMSLGQVNVFILWTTVLFLYWLRLKKNIAAGVVLAFSIFMKPFALGILPLLLWRKKFFALGGFLIGTTLITVGSIAVFGLPTTISQFTNTVKMATPSGLYQYLTVQNLNALFGRLTGEASLVGLTLYILSGGVVGGLTLATILLRPDRDDFERETALFIAITHLIAPLTWYHHLTMFSLIFACIVISCYDSSWISYLKKGSDKSAIGYTYLSAVAQHRHFRITILILTGLLLTNMHALFWKQLSNMNILLSSFPVLTALLMWGILLMQVRNEWNFQEK